MSGLFSAEKLFGHSQSIPFFGVINNKNATRIDFFCSRIGKRIGIRVLNESGGAEKLWITGDSRYCKTLLGACEGGSVCFCEVFESIYFLVFDLFERFLGGFGAIFLGVIARVVRISTASRENLYRESWKTDASSRGGQDCPTR
jgi:hypothetical protein